MNRKVLRDWLKAGYVESGRLFPTEAGTPQGGIASPTIANIALDGLEMVLTEQFGSTATAIKRLRVPLLEVKVKPCVEAFLAERGPQLSQEKTRITHISMASTSSDRMYANTTANFLLNRRSKT